MKRLITLSVAKYHISTFLFLFLIVAGSSQNNSSFVASTVHPEAGKIKLKGNPQAVELTEKRTLNSRLFDNKDGSKSIVSYDYPVHYTKNNALLSIDNSIQQNNSGLFNTHSYIARKINEI